MNKSKTTKAEQSKTTIGKLVAIATREFGRKGYAAASTEEIVRLAGVTRGALYHHFKNKQDLYLAVFKVCGAASLGLSLGILIMIFLPFAKYGHKWSYFSIPVLGLLFWLSTLATTLHVANTTGADTPWKGSLFCVIAILLAHGFSLIELSLRRRDAKPAI